MAVQLDLPLPEITVNDFKRACTHFELVTDAKDWNENKQSYFANTALWKVSRHLFDH